MKEIRSRKAVTLNERQRIKLGKRLFLYILCSSMVISAPWIFPQILKNNPVLAAMKEEKNKSNAIKSTVSHNTSDPLSASSDGLGERIKPQDESKHSDNYTSAPLDPNSGQLIENAIVEDKHPVTAPDASNSGRLDNPSGTDSGSDANPESENTKDSTSSPDTSSIYSTVDNSYFDDALFIGDSRTVGIFEYANLNNADFFCHSGLTTYSILKERISVKNYGKISLLELLAQKKYGKIYITLGINEIGNPIEEIMQKYNQLVVAVQQANPGSIIYLQGNLHVSQAKSSSHSYIKNERINILNAYIEGDADNKTVFYLNPNEYFDDANGNLKADLTGDGVHPYGKYYAEWVEWLKTKAIRRS